MKNVFILLVYLSLSLTARAVSIGGTPVLPVTGAATNVSLTAHALYTTNLVPRMEPVVVSGAAESPLVNQTYWISFSNTVAGVQRVIWTNAVNSTLIEYRAGGDNGFASDMSIEATTNDFADTFYYSIFYDQSPIPTGLAMSFLGDTGDVSAALGQAVTAYQVAELSGAYLRQSAVITNIVVDKRTGTAKSTRTNGLPFVSAGAACAAGLVAGDVVNVMPDVYSDDTSINPPKGVIINFNNSTIGAPLNIVDDNQIYNLVTSVQPHVNTTNASNLTIIDNVKVVASTDYMLFDNVNGHLIINLPQNYGKWDSMIISRTHTNSLIEIHSPNLRTEQDRLTSVTWGMHGLGWSIGPTNGGRIEIYGGAFSVMNTTNLVGVGGTGLLFDACIGISDAGGSTTNFNNASMGIYGTTLIHGSTNASTVTAAITNQLGIPIDGFYTDIVPGIKPNMPPASSTFVRLGSSASPVRTVTANYTMTASDDTVRINSTTKTVTLPTAVGATGRTYTVKLVANSTGTVGTTSSQTIDGSTTYSLSAQYKYVTVKSDGANWSIVANN